MDKAGMTPINIEAIAEFMESTTMDFAIRRRMNALVTEVERVRTLWDPVCADTGQKAVSGVCPEHGGDACLLVNELYQARAEVEMLRDVANSMCEALADIGFDSDEALEKARDIGLASA